MSINITLLNAQGNTKLAFSPYEDGSFIFANQRPNSLKEAYEFLKKNYTLSRPLNLIEPVKTFKTKKDLEQYIPEKIDNIIISLTEINSRFDMDEVIAYFNDKNYACILGQGTDYDGKKNFQLSGILKVNFKSNEETIKNTLMIIQSELGDKARIDLFSSSSISVNPPIEKSNILLSKENGKILQNSDIRPVLSTAHNTKHLNISFNDEFIELCLSQFASLGFHASTANAGNSDKKSFSFYRKYESNTQRGYSFLLNNPLIMYHKDKNKQVSIYHLMKNTKEGKEWLKNKTKEEQAHQLIKPTEIKEYKQYYSVDEQYLDFDKHNKKKMIKEFLDSEKGVFKMKSAMGTAKSNGIDYIIEEVHKRNEKVILVSNRISVAKDMEEKYRAHDLILYQDPDSEISNKSLVVQFDSLHRFDLSKYDVAIFDEYVSLLLQHRSNLSDNANINAVKFKILQDTKRTVIADAFLTGYDLSFFNNRDIWFLDNKYKDDVKLFDYEQREYFITELIYNAQLLKENEHISASFTSLNIIRLVEYELRKNGIKVISLTSETAETTRDIIYKKFKEEEHSSFQVILYTPTLTVGVSNLNNIISHWHYDSSMGADVISSLQMIKRSRKAKEIHYFIQSRQNHFDTNIDSLNTNAQRNITQYYNGKDKNLLIEVDYTTGNMTLTMLAKYINKIEAFHNILSNNHANAFRLLLSYQFKGIPTLIQNIDHNYNIKNKLKEIKKIKRDSLLKIINEYGEVDYTDEDLYYINNKKTELNDEEYIKSFYSSIQKNFKQQLTKSDLYTIAKIEIDSGFVFISYIKCIYILLQISSDETIKRELNDLSSNINILQNNTHYNFIKHASKFNEKLNGCYTKLEINNINKKYYEGKKHFDKVLKGCGFRYNKKNKKFEVDTRVYNYLLYMSP